MIIRHQELMPTLVWQCLITLLIQNETAIPLILSQRNAPPDPLYFGDENAQRQPVGTLKRPER